MPYSFSLTQSLWMAAFSLRLPLVWHHLQGQSPPPSDKDLKQMGPSRAPCGAPLEPACPPFAHLIFAKPYVEYKNIVRNSFKS